MKSITMITTIVVGLMLSGVVVKSDVICEPLVTHGSVLITRASSGNGEFRVYDPAGGECTYRGNVVLGYLPAGIEIGPNGNIFVWQQSGGPMFEYDRSTGELVGQVIPDGTGLQGRGFCFLPGGDILVAGGSASRVARFDGSTGNYLGDFVTAGSGGLTTCFGITLGPDGNLFACSVDTNEVLEYDGVTGSYIGAYASVTTPYDLAFKSDGSLVVASYYDGNIFHFDCAGLPLGQFNDVNLSPARGIDVGLDGDVYVASWSNHGGYQSGAYRLDGESGELLGSFYTPSAIFCSVAPQDEARDDASRGKHSTLTDFCEGACCTNGICVITDVDDCDYFGGLWLGTGTTCDDSPCPSDCLGDANGDGEVSVNDILIVIAQFGVTCP